jgi:K+-sensing histidine kinase KdpD
VQADGARMEQVVTNLLVNAVKYTDPGGRIEISVEREGTQAVVRVTDNGIGIGPELLPQLFDLFVQGRQNLDRARGGLGLGLTLVKRLVELQGGSVEAISEGLGHGSTFVKEFDVNPAIVGKVLDIFRVFYNFVETGDDKKTPAMRLGLTKKPVFYNDILICS